MYSLNLETIFMILGVSLAVYLVAKYTGNLRENFADPTFCYPCEKQSSSDPSFCVSCANCYYDNGICKSIDAALTSLSPYTAPIYGFNSSSWYRPWTWNWNTWVR